METRNSRMKNKQHIDNVQTSTVDEHFKLIIEDDSIHNPILNVTPDDLPNWYNKKLYKEAQDYYNRNLLAINTANFIGLMVVFSIATIQKVLEYTKQSSIPCAAFKRYAKTMLYLHYIYTSDPNNPDSNWCKSINEIRQKHKMNSEKSQNAGVGPIYQRDMALTQFAFVGYILLMNKFFGIPHNTPAEEEAFNHFWRVTGYMLGIPDKLNICRKTTAETRKLCHKIIKEICINYLIINEGSPIFHHMVSTVINSLWYIDINLNVDSILVLTYRIHGIEYKKPLEWYSWLNLMYIDSIFKLCLIPYIGKVVKMYFNYLTVLKIFLVENFPILAWAKFGKENVRINLYSNSK